MSLDQAIKQRAAAAASGYAQARHGIVSAVDPNTHSIKAILQPEGLETGWMPDMAAAAAGMRIASPCEIGTQLLLESVEGDAENWLPVARIFDLTICPPVSPSTGTVAQPGELLVMAGQGAPPAQDGGSVGSATQGAGWLHVTTGGVFLGAGGVTLAITSSGVAVTGGPISSDTDVLAAGISGKMHRHTGVQSGQSETGQTTNA